MSKHTDVSLLKGEKVWSVIGFPDVVAKRVKDNSRGNGNRQKYYVAGKRRLEEIASEHGADDEDQSADPDEEDPVLLHSGQDLGEDCTSLHEHVGEADMIGNYTTTAEASMFPTSTPLYSDRRNATSSIGHPEQIEAAGYATLKRHRDREEGVTEQPTTRIPAAVLAAAAARPVKKTRKLTKASDTTAALAAELEEPKSTRQRGKQTNKQSSADNTKK